jgi:hypothetical protein
MLCFGYLAGLAVLNGWIQSRSGLSTGVFGFVLATGAVAALLVNIYIRRRGLRLSGEFGLLLLSFAVWLPVLAQSLPALLLAYSLQGAASRIALAGLYRAITEVQRRSLLLGCEANTTLSLESMAGFGLALSFLLNSQLTERLGAGWPSAALAMLTGVAAALGLRQKLPDWMDQNPKPGGRSGSQGGSLVFAFAIYCTEVFTMTQATAWGSILTGELQFGSKTLAPLSAGGLMTGVFWFVVGSVRWIAGRRSDIDLRRVVVGGLVFCLLAVAGVMASGSRGLPLLISYASLGAGIACFVPFALQTIAQQPNAGKLADRFALLGPVMSVAVHLLTGLAPGWREVFVLAALSTAFALAWRNRKIPHPRVPGTTGADGVPFPEGRLEATSSSAERSRP